MPEHTAAPSEQTAPMRLAKILDSFIPGMHDTPCRIAIFTDGRKIKVFEKVYFRRPAFDPPLPQTWERNYWLERYQTPQAVENHLQKNGLLKENIRKTNSMRYPLHWSLRAPVWRKSWAGS